MGYLYTATLSGLTPGAKYNYRVEAGGKTSAPSTFTAPAAGAAFPFTMGAVADLGEACVEPGCGNATIRALGDAAASGNISLLLHAGDIAYIRGDETQ